MPIKESTRVEIQVLSSLSELFLGSLHNKLSTCLAVSVAMGQVGSYRWKKAYFDFCSHVNSVNHRFMGIQVVKPSKAVYSLVTYVHLLIH